MVERQLAARGIHGELAELARRRCRDLGYDDVHVLHGDGTLGWPDHAPYDAISIAEVSGVPDTYPFGL